MTLTRSETIALCDLAWNAMAKLNKAYNNGGLPADLFDDCADEDEANERLHTLSQLIFAYQDEYPLFERDDMIEPKIMQACPSYPSSDDA